MNELKFSGKAEIYDKARLGYPDEVIEYIFSLLPSCPMVADVGSGTGKLTESLLRKGCRIFAVEPNPEMRAISDSRLCNYGSSYTGIDGTAENTRVPEHSCDCVTVAQALHWFDVEKFRDECGRILKPEGKVFIVYNKFSGALADKYEDFLASCCSRFKGLGGGDSDEKIKQFFGGKFICKTVKLQVAYDSEHFIGRALSASYTPKPCDVNYSEFIQAMHVFFEKYKYGEQLIFDNITSVYHQ